MDKETQRIAWSCLPKEFKEGVKRQYQIACDCNWHEVQCTLEYLFGEHNLTSDAEGEEELQERLWNMLTPKLQTYCYNMGHTSHDGNVEDVLTHLFGSKCLPDEVSEVKRTLSENLSEPKPVEPEEEIRKSRTSPEDGGSWHASMIGSEAATAVLNDSSDDRRLTIAAMAMQGILSNPTAVNGPKLIDGDEEIAAMWSLKFADALIAECEKKGGSDEKD